VSLQGGTLSGTGNINGDLSNAADVSIGDPFTTAALTVTGNYTQTSSGTLTVKLGVGTSDDLSITGMATLAGTLNVVLIGGYTPVAGDSFAVLACNSETGTLTLAGSGLLFSANYDPMDVTLVAN
jgi:hypothetical protein